MQLESSVDPTHGAAVTERVGQLELSRFFLVEEEKRGPHDAEALPDTLTFAL